MVDRATERRSSVLSPDGLKDYSARAQGFVLFLTQVGEGFTDAPRLVKADQLVLEVYWQAPGNSKQRIVGWRDRVDLPTDINYHRDHLGIVQNDFSDRIRLGDGHEVQDIVHPLSPAGRDLYDFAVVDSLFIEFPERAVSVYQLLVRPKDAAAPAVVGSLFLDASDGGVVRFQFSFTQASYRDDSVEDITVTLENGLWLGRHWLPRYQDIEIRRRSSWLDIPARGLIQARWIIDDYQFNVGLPPGTFLGPEIVAAAPEIRDTFGWNGSLEQNLESERRLGPLVNATEVRNAVRDIVDARLLNGLSGARPGVRSLSRLLHFNRVEGLTPGFGAVFRNSPFAGIELAAWAGIGLSDERLKWHVDLSPAAIPAIRAYFGHEMRDLSDAPVVSPVLNSVLAQELGRDFGDYYLSDRVGMNGATRLAGLDLQVDISYWRVESVSVAANPANGSFRPNPVLGSGEYGVFAAASRWESEGLSAATVGLAVEAGIGSASYGRVEFSLGLRHRAGATALAARAWMGVGTPELPLHRSFAIGGRGTLIGESFRAWGGRRAAYGQLEWQVPVPFPSLPLGSFGSTGAAIVVAPFVGAAWAGGDFAELPWRGSDGMRPVVGLGIEWLHRLVRADFGYSVEDSRLRFSIDLRPYFWSIL